MELLSKAARLSVKARDFDKALQLLEKTRNLYDIVENLGAVYKVGLMSEVLMIRVFLGLK